MTTSKRRKKHRSFVLEEARLFIKVQASFVHMACKHKTKTYKKCDAPVCKKANEILNNL